MRAAQTETIERAAMLLRGRVFVAEPRGRHSDVMTLMAEEGLRPPDIAKARQGFWTSRQRFVDRAAALRIARAAGQVGADTTTGNPRELFSEDLW